MLLGALVAVVYRLENASPPCSFDDSQCCAHNFHTFHHYEETIGLQSSLIRSSLLSSVDDLMEIFKSFRGRKRRFLFHLGAFRGRITSLEPI